MTARSFAALSLAGALLLGACSEDGEYFGKVQPREGQVFRFNNGAEPEYKDPQLMTGQPDGRIAWALFEGLTSYDPKDLSPRPGVAESWELSEDGRRYTFHLRRDARWSNGDPITSEDFLYSWRRFLTPATAAQYAYLLFSVTNAQAYCTSQLVGSLGVESWQIDGQDQALGAGRSASVVLSRELSEEQVATGRYQTSFRLDLPGGAGPFTGTLFVEEDGTARGEADGEVLRGENPVEVALELDGHLDRDEETGRISGRLLGRGEGLELAARIDARFATPEDLSISAPDEFTFVVELDYPVPYFLALTSFYPLSPVPRKIIEAYGEKWTDVANIVSNGAFRLVEHSLQNQMVMVRNEHYWDVENVRLDKVIAYPVELYTTGCDLYKAGEIDLEPSNYIPLAFLPIMTKKKDYHTFPYLTVYFYRVNVTHPALKDKRVRTALALSVDRQALVDFLKAGQLPAYHYVPTGIAGYDPPAILGYRPDEARRLLAEAGYPKGKDFPKIDILYNTTEQHKQIAEVIQQMWKKELGIDIGLKNQEWKVYLKSQRNLDYEVSRSGWIGDYADPNTFLDMFLTGGGNNNTGFSHPLYDRLIGDAAREQDPVRRMELFREAEELLMEELPIIPLYIYTTYYLKKPYVRGHESNIQDIHPLKYIWIDHDWAAKE